MTNQTQNEQQKERPWQNIKNMLSDKLLMYGLQLLPSGSPERRELAEFLLGYFQRSVKRLM